MTSTSSCKKDENKYGWTDINIHIDEVNSNDLPDSLSFRVQAKKKSSDFYESTIIKGESYNEIEDYIVAGKYNGGFVSKSKKRWSYYLEIKDNFQDSFYLVFPNKNSYKYFDIEKRKENNIHLILSKKQKVTFKSFLSNCTGVGDKVIILMRHKVYRPSLDISENSEKWESGSERFWISGCDTIERNYYFPSGQYEVAVKTQIQGNITGYYTLDFQVYEGSTNQMELYY